MGSISLKHTDSGSGVILSSDGTNLLLDGVPVGQLELYAENPSSPTAPSATGTNAVAIGSGASASGFAATALGENSSASGTRGTAIGGGSVTGNSTSIAIGSGALASANVATAIGPLTDATSAGALAIGYSAQAVSGSYATAVSRSYASGTDSFAAAIANNTSSYGATGANSVAIGDRAKATSSDSFCISNASTASGAGSSVLGGQSNTATANTATSIGGDSNTASGVRSVAYGYYGNTNGILGKVAHGIGPSRQNGMYGLAIDTADATPRQLVTDYFFAGNATNQIILPNNSAYAFHGTIVARQQASAGSEYAAWEIKGAILRDGTAATTVLGNGIKNSLYASAGAAAWDISLTADTTNGGLAITVTGAAATNIRWVATCHTSEVTF